MRRTIHSAAINKYGYSEEKRAYIDTVRDEYSYAHYLEFYKKKGRTPIVLGEKDTGFCASFESFAYLNLGYTDYKELGPGEIVVLTLTNIDLKLFLEHYEVFELEYIDGFMFKSQSGLFKTYIDYWSNKKIEAKKEGNDAIYKISKLMLNSLYGKFGLNPNVRSKYPTLEDDKIRYIMHDPEIRDPIYIPVATFVTSYARNKTIRTSQRVRDYTIKNYGKDFYIYSDTDSIHMLKMDEEELKKFVDIDDYILGYWKLESEFVQGKFLRQKCYIEKSKDGKINVTVAGLPKFLGDKITFENFKEGFTAKGKLTFGHVNGGVILKETDFTIK